MRRYSIPDRPLRGNALAERFEGASDDVGIRWAIESQEVAVRCGPSRMRVGVGDERALVHRRRRTPG